MSDRLELVLPLPPSVNHSHVPSVRRSRRTGKLYKRPVPSRACRAWRHGAWVVTRDAIEDASWKTIRRPAHVIVELRYFWPDLRRRDTHNRIKEVCDALQLARVFEDDSQVLAREVGFELDRVNGRVEIAVFVEEPTP